MIPLLKYLRAILTRLASLTRNRKDRPMLDADTLSRLVTRKDAAVDAFVAAKGTDALPTMVADLKAQNGALLPEKMVALRQQAAAGISHLPPDVQPAGQKLVEAIDDFLAAFPGMRFYGEQ